MLGGGFARFKEGEKCAPHIKHVLFLYAGLFYIILDNFPLVRTPAKAYFFPFIRFLYRSILLTSIFLSPFAKYGLFFTASPPFFVNLPILPALIRSHHTRSFCLSSVQPPLGIYVLTHFALQTWYSIGVARYLESILTFGVRDIIFVMFLCVFNAFLPLLLPGEE